jgi:hypothetical protein
LQAANKQFRFQETNGIWRRPQSKLDCRKANSFANLPGSETNPVKLGFITAPGCERCTIFGASSSRHILKITI